VWNADRWGIDTEHMFAGEDFNPEVGFVRRPEGFQHLKANLRFSPRPRNIPGVRKLYYTTSVQYFTDPSWSKVESRDQTPRMFVSGLVQYQSRNDAVSTNTRFRWEYRPGSELFVVYSDGRTTLSRGIPDVQNRSCVVKVTRLFQF
jgi:hypothetical protein